MAGSFSFFGVMHVICALFFLFCLRADMYVYDTKHGAKIVNMTCVIFLDFVDLHSEAVLLVDFVALISF